MSEVYLAFDMGGSFLKYGVLDSQGQLMDVSKQKVGESWESLVESFDEVISSLNDTILGIGISTPGTVDIQAGIVYDGGLLPYLNGKNLKEHIETRYNIPCRVTNDGKAAIQAELWQGNLQGAKDASAVVLGSAVAGAIILDGKLREGPNFKAGEYSFATTLKGNDFGVSNMIGSQGSAVQFIERCANHLGLEDTHDGVSVFEAIEAKNDSVINDYFKDYCRVVANFVMNLQAILDIEKVVIGGGISQQPVLIEGINEAYQELRQVIPVLHDKISPIEIEACRFDNSSNLIGAIYPFFESK